MTLLIHVDVKGFLERENASRNMNVSWHLGSKEIALVLNVATQLLPRDAFVS